MRALLLLPAILLLAACGGKDEKAAPGVTGGPTRTKADPPAVERPPKKIPIAPAIEDGEAEEDDPVPPVVTVPWRGQGDVLEFSVWHMHCDGCEADVEEALTKLDVGAVEADYKTSLVTIKLKDAAQRDAVIAKVRAALKGGEFRILGE